ncbi:MAG: hypothetical protein U0529_03255 [Thermoanaerobaculia bacterium]
MSSLHGAVVAAPLDTGERPLASGRATSRARSAGVALLLLVAAALPAARVRRVWSIAIYEGPSILELRPAEGVENPVLTGGSVTDVPARFVADPFLLRRPDGWNLFFEVLDESTGRGAIGHAVSADGFRWTYRGIVLAEPFHLSFPQVFESDGEIFMVPESGAANEVRLYRADPFPVRWRYEATLLSGHPFSDPVLLEESGSYWLFTVLEPYRNADLHLFRSTALRGPYVEHPASPVVRGNPHGARAAGRIVHDGGRLVRLAQDDAPRYGRAVRAFEITDLGATTYAERPLAADPILGPGLHGWSFRGMHHADVLPIAPGRLLAAVDGQGRALSFEFGGPSAGRVR